MKTWQPKRVVADSTQQNKQDLDKGVVARGVKLFDADGQILGRLATKIAVSLRGKDKAHYARHMNTGDMVIVVNASKIVVTGNKAKGKIYYRHTGYTGSLKEETFEHKHERDPVSVVRLAVKRMLPRGPLGREMYSNLRVYAQNEHNHGAQLGVEE